MAVEANAYLRPDATADGVVPNLYDEQAEKYLYEAEALRFLAIEKSAMIQGRPGKTLQVFKETQFTVGELTEGVDTPVSALDFDSVTVGILPQLFDHSGGSSHTITFNLSFTGLSAGEYALIDGLVTQATSYNWTVSGLSYSM